MTPERIAYLRERLPAPSQNGDVHVARCHEVLDALEAAQAELVALRGGHLRSAVPEGKALVGDEVLELLCMEGDIRETKRLGLFVSGKVRDHLDNLDSLRASQRPGQSEAGGGAG